MQRCLIVFDINSEASREKKIGVSILALIIKTKLESSFVRSSHKTIYHEFNRVCGLKMRSFVLLKVQTLKSKLDQTN